jgi:hypothetical protein
MHPEIVRIVAEEMSNNSASVSADWWLLMFCLMFTVIAVGIVALVMSCAQHEQNISPHTESATE